VFDDVCALEFVRDALEVADWFELLSPPQALKRRANVMKTSVTFKNLIRA
jgi:hypothetical protein